MSGRPVVLCLGTMDRSFVEQIRTLCDVIECHDQDDPLAIGSPERIVAVVARGAVSVPASLIDSLPRLRAVIRTGVGIDNVDVTAATDRDIDVVVTASANDRAVAEGAIALMLHLVKRLGESTTLVATGRWADREKLDIGDVYGSTIGVVGYGRIGRRIAAVSESLGARVVVHDPAALRVAGAHPGFEHVTLEELCDSSDVIQVCVPLTRATHHLIGSDLLSRVKPGCVLVNTSRGPVVDTQALWSALAAGRLAGAGLDVFDPEPPDHEHPLFSLPNVVLTPHLMGWTRAARSAIYEQAAAALAEILAGRSPKNVVNPRPADTAATAPTLRAAPPMTK